ncbi:glutathione S-transferase N-terminal domain-containing protein [Marinimicrococcus flavescens]|uniref:Glutathione S-transferase N-terminal domain-containing protein n=1 Tax=Marinimicrococcus flavescens TaxID=3031815 RepID=A0AAP3XR14_9PROT|nr:glutathione S-transferase N-terminal domain-containing protein [Marinimicrococcus flavescens]
MSIVLYDLAGREDRRFGPTCWRVRMALAHKQLAFETVPVRFLDIRGIGGEEGSPGFRTVPTIRAEGRWITDSDAIAAWLEEAFPDRPTLFGGEGGRKLTDFFRQWVQQILHAQIVRMVLVDVHDHLADAQDQAYFRETREALFKAPLETVAAGREARIEPFRASLEPLRQTLKDRPFLGGEAPLHADYMVLGAFQWARTVSPFAARLLAADDPLRAWLGRLMELHGGLAGRAVAYPL